MELSKINYGGLDEVNDKCDEEYGGQLLNYINNKHLTNILNKNGV